MRLKDGENAIDAAEAELIGATSLYFRARTLGAIVGFLASARASASLGRETLDELQRKDEKGAADAAVLFSEWSKKTWLEYIHVCANLQDDLVSFQSPLGRKLHRRRQSKKSEQAIKKAAIEEVAAVDQQFIAELPERTERLNRELEQQRELTRLAVEEAEKARAARRH